MNHYRKLERMYLSAPINDAYAPTLHIEEGQAKVEFAVRPEHFHAAGSLHGSVYFKALDDAAYFAASSLVTDAFMVTVSFNVYLLRPVTKGMLQASGRVVSRSARLFVAESLLKVDGRQVARGSGTFTRSRVALTESLGYK